MQKMEEKTQSTDINRHNFYSKVQESLEKRHLDLSGRYDQWILTLTGGALALSITFLEKIAPEPRPDTKVLIALAWLFLVAALVSALMSLAFATRAAMEQIDIWKADYEDAREKRTRCKRENKWDKFTGILNGISGIGFVGGVTFLCLFAFMNILTPKKKPIESLTPSTQTNYHNLTNQINLNIKFQ